MERRLVTPDLAHMASFVDALREGYQRDTLRAETPQAIAQIAREPDWFLRQLNDPPAHIVLPDGTLGERVLETQLWYVEGDEFLGSISVRHRLPSSNNGAATSAMPCDLPPGAAAMPRPCWPRCLTMCARTCRWSG